MTDLAAMLDRIGARQRVAKRSDIEVPSYLVRDLIADGEALLAALRAVLTVPDSLKPTGDARTIGPLFHAGWSGALDAAGHEVRRVIGETLGATDG